LPPHTAHKPMRWKSKPAPSVDWLTNTMRRRSGAKLLRPAILIFPKGKNCPVGATRPCRRKPTCCIKIHAGRPVAGSGKSARVGAVSSTCMYPTMPPVWSWRILLQKSRGGMHLAFGSRRPARHRTAHGLFAPRQGESRADRPREPRILARRQRHVDQAPAAAGQHCRRLPIPGRAQYRHQLVPLGVRRAVSTGDRVDFATPRRCRSGAARDWRRHERTKVPSRVRAIEYQGSFVKVILDKIGDDEFMSRIVYSIVTHSPSEMW